MRTLSKPPSLDAISVRQLHRALEGGRFAIPRLQREFVWKGPKAASLLDSVYRQMPVGALTIWEAPRSHQNLLRHALHVLPPFKPHHDTIWFVIDGQQRLSVLYQALSGEQRNGVDFSRLCFRVDGHGEGGWFRYRKTDGKQWIPVKDILATQWRSRLDGLRKVELAHAQRCRAALLAYRVPTVFVTTAKLDTVRELFIRINSLGTPIGAADRAFAFASVIDLRDKARELLAKLGKGAPGYGAIPDEVLLQAFALADGETDVGERSYTKVITRWERDARANDKKKQAMLKAWAALGKSLERAVQYLRDAFGVEDHRDLPSDYMVALLALFFHRQGRSSTTASQKREIRKWFWATGVGQRYSGRGFRKNIAEDAHFFERLAHGKAVFHVGERVDPTELRRTEYQRQTGLGNAFFCLLLRHGPVHLDSGDPIPAQYFVFSASRKDRHHVFPQALLRYHKLPAREINSLCNVCLLTAEQNQSVGSKKPLTYLGSLRAKKHFAGVARAHLLPHKADSGLWEPNIRRGYKRFVQQRLRLICAAFEREAGTKLFKKVGQ